MPKRNTNRSLMLVIASLFFVLLNACGNQEDTLVASPDGQYVFNLKMNDGLLYSINWRNNPLIENSALGFQLADSSIVPGEVNIEKVTTSSRNEEWKPVYGEKAVYTDNYNEALIEFSGSNPGVEYFAIRVRAYNEGVAFRYEFMQKNNIEIISELTEFSFRNDPSIWASSRAQSPIEKQKLSELNFIAERPLLAELSDSVFVALGEAGLLDFARMKFARDSSSVNKLSASLDMENSGSQGEATASANIPKGAYSTPWRYVMAGSTPAQILQNNYLLLNLNEANKISDTSWIKPGKVIREVTLTTQGGVACVDFAAKHNLQYIEFDAGWYGPEYDVASDATTVTVDPNRSPGPLDLPSVIDYAKSKGIGVILYVNRRALEKQLDEILPLYKEWGIAGLKYGFVNVGPQKWTTWLHEAIAKAADHELMVDVHDEYRPTGVSRTYPNFMTQEGIRGDEESTPNDMVINTIFTRMIAGAGDQTNCYFAERVSEKMGSHASQMAKTICIYSPWQFLYWYDRPAGSPAKKGGAGDAEGGIPEIADLAFFDQVPTVWDDTKIIEGYPGKLAVIARRKGENWYLGAIAGTKAQTLSVKLDFLEPGKMYNATIYSDDKSLNTPTNLRITETGVNSKSVLNQQILEQNGLAVIFTPGAAVSNR